MSESNPDNLQQVERETITRVLADLKGNMSAAARRLGIDRRTLYRKVYQYQLIQKPIVCPTCGAERG